MEVVQLVEEARMLGALFDVRYGKTQVYGCLAPGELTLELVAKLHDNRERIPGHLFDYERCAVCTCATEGARLPPICPLCQSMYCVQCGACTAFRSQWTPSWAEPGARDQLLPEILSRLREGHEWFCQQTKNFYYALSDAGDAAFARAEAKWFDLETTARQVYGYKGCVLGEGVECPADAPVRCSMCTAMLEDPTKSSFEELPPWEI